ncbi:hypothetical protein DYL72_15460 [Vibrio anguillarum]|uniref:Uncharacterized protein n=1 Tax=Vibrio anguillarum TaxID=55601 RepID=A0A7U6FS46_VIBAN|nr:hypothetical protein [Vibrio anguillarum]AZS26305.1 hypothetical protein DYL72_15460 [Vibrio anguillarum]
MYSSRKTRHFKLYTWGVSVLCIALASAAPLEVSLESTFNDWHNMGLKIPMYLVSGVLVVYLTSSYLPKHEVRTFIAALGCYLFFYPLLALISSIQNVSSFVAVASVFCIVLCSYATAELVLNKLDSKESV